MSNVRPADGITFEADADVVVIGGGAAGLIAALTAVEAGASVIVLERDVVPRGSTSLSAGLIPAAGTAVQRRQGIDDDPTRFAADIQAKAEQRADRTVVAASVAAVGPTIDWLAGKHGLPFEVITDFRYPGHSVARMHALPRRTGAELVDRLRTAIEATDVALLTSARVDVLFADASGRVSGVEVDRPSGRERIGCTALVLACNGYGGNKDLVRRYMPRMIDAHWTGHSGNTGDAVSWGTELGAELRDMTGHQGHGSVAIPHGILITWATMTEGGFQVNAQGERFSDESHGYSEQGEVVLAQPGAVAWSVFDERIAAIARQFEDFRLAEAQGAVLTAATMEDLARRAGLPAAALVRTAAAVDAIKATGGNDLFGRRFAGSQPLRAPFHAVKVTGALFHTQGGLAIDGETRVLRADGRALPNLLAAGGAAVGASGPFASGYLSGNGLLTAVALGRLSGGAAARLRGARAPT